MQLAETTPTHLMTEAIDGSFPTPYDCPTRTCWTSRDLDVAAVTSTDEPQLSSPDGRCRVAPR